MPHKQEYKYNLSTSTSQAIQLYMFASSNYRLDEEKMKKKKI